MDLTSEDDDDVAFSVPGYAAARSSFVGSSYSRSSSLQNPEPKPPSSTRPLVSGFAYNAAQSGSSSASTTKRQQQQQQQQVSQNENKPTPPTKARIPRQPYVGPSLDAADEPTNEELEFEKFKMRTRMEKIVEFHEAAALAEISLSIEIYKARKQLNNSKEEDAPRVLDHQKRMLQLQMEKEEERKSIVRAERARRQSDLGRHLTPGGVKERPTSSASAFKSWDMSSLQEETNISSRFNLEALLSDDPAKQQPNVESLLSEMFADDYQPVSAPEVSADSLFHRYSSASTPSNPGSAQEQLRQTHSSMSWNKPRSNPKLQQKSRVSPFGESSDEEDDAPAAVVANSNKNDGWATNEPNGKPIWNNKPNAATPAIASPHPSTKDVGTTPMSSAWNSKKTTASTSQFRPGSSMMADPYSFFDAEDIKAEPTATPVVDSKTVKGKKPLKTPSAPPAVEATTSKVSATETPTAPPAPVPAPVPVSPPVSAPAPAPVGKKQNKKQRQGKKAGTAAPPAAVTETPVPEHEPETEPALPQRESPKLETPVAAPDPAPQVSEHTSWLPKTVPAMARSRMDSESATPSSFSWDEVSSTPRPAPKIPAHLQDAVKSEGTPRPNMFKKQNLMASATSSRTTLEQMPLAKGPVEQTLLPPIAKGPIWASVPTSVTPGPSLWGKTKADFEPPKVVQQPTGSEFWVPENFDGVDNYNDEGEGGGGGSEAGRDSLWESTATTNSKQIKKAAPIPVKQQQQQPSGAAQRLRRVSEAASSPAPRTLGTKGLSDIGQPASSLATPNSKKARGKKTGKGKQRATVEDVSDEEKDNIDILPQDSSFIMESKVILEPKPSVPPIVYDPIIKFADNDLNEIEYLASAFRPTAPTTSGSSPDDIFGMESHYSNPFKTQGVNTSIGSEWGAISGSGKHARWTPAVVTHEESSGSPNFSASFGPGLQAKPSVQQMPIWGQPTKSGAKDKGKGK